MVGKESKAVNGKEVQVGTRVVINMYIIINSSVDMQLYGLFCCRILKSIFEKAFQFEAMSKIYIATDSLLLWSVSFQNSGIEKAFLFDVISKSYVATDSFFFFLQFMSLVCFRILG